MCIRDSAVSALKADRSELLLLSSTVGSKADRSELTELRDVLDTRPNRTEVAALLEPKADLSYVSEQLGLRATTATVDALTAVVDTKLEQEDLTDVNDAVTNYAARLDSLSTTVDGKAAQSEMLLLEHEVHEMVWSLNVTIGEMDNQTVAQLTQETVSYTHLTLPTIYSV